MLSQNRSRNRLTGACREAERVLKRKHEKTYSDRWHRNVGIAFSTVASRFRKPLRPPSGLDQGHGSGREERADHQQQLFAAFGPGGYLHQVRAADRPYETLALVDCATEEADQTSTSHRSLQRPHKNLPKSRQAAMPGSRS